MGESWFVLYKYYQIIDSKETGRKNTKTTNRRIKCFNRTKKHHVDWLKEIIKINENKLDTNRLDVDCFAISTMLCIILDNLFSCPIDNS